MDVEQGGERQGPGWGGELGHDVALKAGKAFLSPSEPRAFSVGTHRMVLPPMGSLGDHQNIEQLA